MTARRQHYDVIRPAQSCSDSTTAYQRGAFINGEYVLIGHTLILPRRDALHEQTRTVTNSKPRSRD